MKTILLTGFEPFGKVAKNPSQQIVEHFAKHSPANVHLITRILPVTYQGSSACLCDLLEDDAIDALLMLGVSASRPAISLERFALNINDASLPDNDGVLRQGEPIIPNGVQALTGTLPLKQMYDAITHCEIPVRFSNHAGAYVCNHIYYSAIHELNHRNLQIPCGFVHVPSLATISLEKQIDAIACCLDVLAAH